MIETLILGVHLASIHIPAEPWQNNTNPGIYVRADGWTAGTYRNTLRRQSVYFGHQFELGAVSFGVGAISGYKKECTSGVCFGATKHKWSPMFAPSVAIPVQILGATPRLWYVPGFANSASVFHISLERKL
jgi:hypothetical protein